MECEPVSNEFDYSSFSRGEFLKALNIKIMLKQYLKFYIQKTLIMKENS